MRPPALGRGLLTSALLHLAALGAATLARPTPASTRAPVFRVALVAAPASAGPPRTGAGPAAAFNRPLVAPVLGPRTTTAKATAAPRPVAPKHVVPALTAASVAPAHAPAGAKVPTPHVPHAATSPAATSHATPPHAAPAPAAKPTAKPAHAAPSDVHAGATKTASASASTAKTATKPTAKPVARPALATTAPAKSPPHAAAAATKSAVGPTSTKSGGAPASAAHGGPTTHAAAPGRATGAPSARGHDAVDVHIVGLAFPYPGYLDNLVRQVRLRFEPAQARAGLHADLAFLVARDGSVSGLHVVHGSGNYAFDLEAQGAVEAAGAAHAFGPLPEGFPGHTLPVTFSFDPRTAQ